MINSALVQAVNSWQETFAGISYTQVFTTFDELVLPSAVGNNSSSLTTGNGQRTNVAVQQICSGDTSEHMMVGTTDPVAYRLRIDAVDHPGPANPASDRTIGVRRAIHARRRPGYRDGQPRRLVRRCGRRFLHPRQEWSPLSPAARLHARTSTLERSPTVANVMRRRFGDGEHRRR